jgi:NAD(P)-dependent dehydrogenase (short-subunit alcohol dehydrogenase family)
VHVTSTHRLDERVVLVTGAAHGVGAATVRALVNAGASVAAIDVDEPGLAGLMAQLGDRVHTHVADITDYAALERATGSVLERFGRIDAVVANAGIEILDWADEMDPADFRRVIEVDLIGTWNTVRATLPAVKRACGYYLVVSSLAAVTNGPMNAAYNAAKAGVVAMARTLRLELRPFGVEIGVSYLTYTDTPTGKRSVEDPRMQAILKGVRAASLRPIPVDEVASRYVRAIARRERRLLFDRSSRVVVAMPEVTQALMERIMRRAIETARRDPPKP